MGSQFSGEGVNEDWEIGDTIAQWWRPNFETFMYPFLPGHVTRPKECKKLYFIQLPKKSGCLSTHGVGGCVLLMMMCRGPLRPKEYEAPGGPAVRTLR